jgi:2-oxoglutarate ferredoxin oxidoreductase subunit gamma
MEMTGSRFEVIMAGIGGQGVLTAGQLLAEAAMADYAYVTWLPSYRAAVRGGASECTVVFSRGEIASFLLSQADVVIVMAISQLPTFLNRVKPKGSLIFETAGLKEEIRRTDIQLFPIPAIETANSMGNIQAANLILLGAYLEITQALPIERIHAQLEKKFVGKARALAFNKEALEKGVEIVRLNFTS